MKVIRRIHFILVILSTTYYKVNSVNYLTCKTKKANFVIT